MPIYLIAGLVLLAFGVFEFMANRLYNLSDVEPENQGGNFKTDFDHDFIDVANARKIPFALLKAHAIQESSLKPEAYRFEPGTSKRPDSASYGLMQLLWWEGSNRWARYGVSDDMISDGSFLYTPHLNIDLAAQLIADNLKACGGNLRDAVSMYNSGH